MDAVYLDRICAVLDDMGVHHLRVAPEVDTVLVQLPEGFAGFQWYGRFGCVLAIHSLHDTSDIPAEVRSGLIERWKAPGPPTGVLAVPGSEREVTPAYCLSSLGEDSTADEVRVEVRRLLGTAILALDKLAELAGISTWEVGDTTVHAIATTGGREPGPGPAMSSQPVVGTVGRPGLRRPLTAPRRRSIV